jgi:hypothetical protein
LLSICLSFNWINAGLLVQQHNSDLSYVSTKHLVRVNCQRNKRPVDGLGYIKLYTWSICTKMVKKFAFHHLPPKLKGIKIEDKWWYEMKFILFNYYLSNSNNKTLFYFIQSLFISSHSNNPSIIFIRNCDRIRVTQYGCVRYIYNLPTILNENHLETHTFFLKRVRSIWSLTIFWRSNLAPTENIRDWIFTL